MAENKPCHWLCENRTFGDEETKLLHKRITQGYSAHLYVLLFVHLVFLLQFCVHNFNYLFRSKTSEHLFTRMISLTDSCC